MNTAPPERAVTSCRFSCNAPSAGAAFPATRHQQVMRPTAEGAVVEVAAEQFGTEPDGLEEGTQGAGPSAVGESVQAPANAPDRMECIMDDPPSHMPRPLHLLTGSPATTGEGRPNV
ncbi:exported hypothetical protein [Arthrobacter sp. 9AX]|nr:exported hypothetical protein [Arthrobacter sp. 9AX]